MIEDILKILFGDSVYSKQLILYRQSKQAFLLLFIGFAISNILFVISLIAAIYMQKIDLFFKEPERKTILMFETKPVELLHERTILENGAGICLPEDAWRYPMETPHVKRKSTK